MLPYKHKSQNRNLRTADLLVKFFQKSLGYLEMKILKKILVPGVSARGDILRKENVLNDAFALGKSMAVHRAYTRRKA